MTNRERYEDKLERISVAIKEDTITFYYCGLHCNSPIELKTYYAPTAYSAIKVVDKWLDEETTYA